MTGPAILMEGNVKDAYFIPSPPRMPLTEDEKLAEAIRLYGEEDGPCVLKDIPALFESEIVNGVTFPHESLNETVGGYSSGCAEPWTSQLVASLLVASNQRNVLEIGSFTGFTTAWLALTLERMGGGTVTAVDIDPERAAKAHARLQTFIFKHTQTQVLVDDSLHFLTTLPNKSVGFAWIDGCHEELHVRQEVMLLWPKMKPGGIMTFHDVYGSTNLQRVVKFYGGYSIDLPRLGKAGGVGIIQIPK